MGYRGIRSTLEIAECDGRPQHSSIIAYQFDRIAVLAGAGGETFRYLAHSRIPTQSRRRNASSRSYSGRSSTDRHASQNDKPAARTRSRIRLPDCRRARDMAPAAFGRSWVIPPCACYQAARSSRSALHCGAPALAPIDRHELDVNANRNRSQVAASEV
jgi:hypothetical protein